MANIFKGEADFTASDGKVWRIVLDFYAYAVACDAMGVDLETLFRKISADVDEQTQQVIRAPQPLDLGYLLYGGLQHNHPAIAIRDAVNLLGEGDAVMAALAKAVDGSVTPPEKRESAEGKEPGNAGDGIGTKPSGHGRKRA